jgi:glycosyltransferase involved in cell wall biosynthesis
LDASVAEAKLDFLFVDDGSTDGTARILSELCGRSNGRMELLRLAPNQGKAEAVRLGVLSAFDREPSPTLIGYWDADLATPLQYVSEFAAILENSRVQLVLGSRVQLLGRHIARSPLRHYLGRAFATAASLSLGFPVYDTQCGAKMFRANAVFRSAFSSPFCGNWTFDVELLERLVRRQTIHRDIEVVEECLEFPLSDWRAVPGSKLGWRHIPQIALETCRIAVRGVERNRQKNIE